ncbi:DMT family transporter [Hippea alviniae]|uniref:DMT family transporter n=1 Tax=Hippea alviniae TaxID=1279027 RepID=UPI0003B76BE2|nr:DMT family transporter [Hippea alviniae]
MKKEGYIYAILATAAMGSLGVFVNYTTVNPFTLTFLRLFIPAILLTAFFIAKGVKFERITLPTIVAGIFLSLTIIFYIFSIRKTTMSLSVFLLYLGPAIAALFAFILLKEPLTKADFLSLVLAMIGLLLILRFKIELKMIGNSLFGILSGISYGLLIVANRAAKQTNTQLSSLYQFAIGSLFVFPLFMFSKPDLNKIESEFAMIFSMAIVCGFLGITLMIAAIKRLRAIEYGVLAYLEILFAVIFGFIFFKDTPDFYKLTGGAFIVAGGFVQTLKARR